MRKEKFCTRLEKLENQEAKLENLELKKFENDLERALAKIARSNPVATFTLDCGLNTCMLYESEQYLTRDERS